MPLYLDCGWVDLCERCVCGVEACWWTPRWAGLRQARDPTDPTDPHMWHMCTYELTSHDLGEDVLLCGVDDGILSRASRGPWLARVLHMGNMDGWGESKGVWSYS